MLCVVAHPTSMEYGASAAVARWTARGIEVGYLLLTRGEAGMPNPPEETARLRVAEQHAACAVVGVHAPDRSSNTPDGVCVYGLDLRRDICREIRRFRARRASWLGVGYAIETPYGFFDQADHRAAGLNARSTPVRRGQPVGLPGAGRPRGPRAVGRREGARGGRQRHAHALGRRVGRALRGVGALARGARGLQRRAARRSSPRPRELLQMILGGGGQAAGVEHAALFDVIRRG